MLHGLRGGGAAQHSHSPQAMLWNAAGLEIVLPSSPYDVKGLMRSAIKSDNPTVFINHARLMDIEGDVPDGDYTIPFGRADIKRAGRDVTVIATSYVVHTALAAAETLASEGIEVEVLDPRTLVPLDQDLILKSVSRTGRLVVVDETNLSCGDCFRIVRHRSRTRLQVAARADHACRPAQYPDSVQSTSRIGHHAHPRQDPRRGAPGHSLDLTR